MVYFEKNTFVYLLKSNSHVPYDTSVLLLGIYTWEMHVHRGQKTKMVMAAFFVVPNTGHKPHVYQS